MAKKITKKQRKEERRLMMPADNFERLAKRLYLKEAFYGSVGGDQVLLPEELFNGLRDKLNAQAV